MDLYHGGWGTMFKFFRTNSAQLPLIWVDNFTQNQHFVLPSRDLFYLPVKTFTYLGGQGRGCGVGAQLVFPFYRVTALFK